MEATVTDQAETQAVQALPSEDVFYQFDPKDFTTGEPFTVQIQNGVTHIARQRPSDGDLRGAFADLAADWAMASRNSTAPVEELEVQVDGDGYAYATVWPEAEENVLTGSILEVRFSPVNANPDVICLRVV